MSSKRDFFFDFLIQKFGKLNEVPFSKKSLFQGPEQVFAGPETEVFSNPDLYPFRINT